MFLWDWLTGKIYRDQRVITLVERIKRRDETIAVQTEIIAALRDAIQALQTRDQLSGLINTADINQLTASNKGNR
jgi:hypothetical protein